MPLVSDELAILTLYCNSDDVAGISSVETMFPAIDVQKRHLILRGFLWQLGEKEISVDAREMAVSTASTYVLAFTLWRDECGEATWSSATSTLVKTVFNLLPNVDAKTQVLQFGAVHSAVSIRKPPQNKPSRVSFMPVCLRTVLSIFFFVPARGPFT